MHDASPSHDQELPWENSTFTTHSGSIPPTLLAQLGDSTLTTVTLPHRCAIAACPYLIHLPADGILIAWLDEKTGKSRSWKTHVAYHATALSLRAALQDHGYELFDDLSNDARYAGYLLIVQQWAGARSADSHHRGEISAATYNHRLAIISSFFDYAKRMRFYRGDNPIDAIARRNVGDQRGARALDMLEMRKRLARVDRKTSAGRRDYALLCVALHTAQRVQALANMHIRDLSWSGERLVIYFPRTKGGEPDEKELEAETSKILSDYLSHRFGERWLEHREDAVWVSYARNQSAGKRLSVQALEMICKKYLGTSQFHTLRHTASLALDDMGIQASEIQTFLRHKNLSTTSTYLKRQKRARNKYGRDLEHVFGIQAPMEEA